MALIMVGSVGDFSVVALESAKKSLSNLDRVDTFSVLAQVTNDVPPNYFDFLVSPNRRGLALQSLQLKEDFQNFIARLFRKESKIYFLAWAWDMSGLYFYPGEHANPTSCLIPLKGGQLREFIGAGAVLFPPRSITAGLALRIQIWESHERMRDFGLLIEKIASAILSSDLNSALIGLAAGAGPATGGASGALAIIEPAALELGKLIGEILKDSADDVVDYFEGYFPASASWSAGPDQRDGHGTTIVLNRLT